MGTFAPFSTLHALGRNPKPLILHAEEGWHDHILNGGCDFFEKIGASARDHGFRPVIIRSEDLRSPALAMGGGLHLMMGPKRHRGPSIFHAQPAYVPGFWYLDPKGYYWNGSLADEIFDPAAVDPGKARHFFNGVSGYMLRMNRSKRPQVARTVDPLPPAAAAIFVQDIEKYRRPVHYLTTEAMIRHTARAAPGLVLVKLHPLQPEDARKSLTALCSTLSNVTLTQASVHDVIAASAMVISQNSAVGFEALMHRKPVLTCARSDYHHATLVCRSGAQLEDSIAAAADHFADFPFEAYFYWFLGLGMLEPQKPDFANRAWDRMLAPHHMIPS